MGVVANSVEAFNVTEIHTPYAELLMLGSMAIAGGVVLVAAGIAGAKIAVDKLFGPADLKDN